MLLPAERQAARFALDRHLESLNARFQTGVPVTLLLQSHVEFIDSLLKDIWRRFLVEYSDQCALVAVGGFGRGELLPHSDIDLLILCSDDQPAGSRADALSHQIRLFVQFLWDLKLKLGHSVRSVEDCVAEARRDQTVITNLIESRLLTGSVDLFLRMKVRTGPDHLWTSREFLEAKLAEQQARYAKFHDTAYNLEPNVKEGPGGLRDIQLLGWIIKRHFHSSGLLNLVGYGCLTESEFAELLAAQQFLWRVRFALHALSGRCEDRLLFEHQKVLAEYFGYRGVTLNDAVEQFMQDYFQTVMRLERLNEMVLQLFKEVVLLPDDEADPVPVDDCFQVVNDYLEVRSPDVFRRQPLALLRIFLVLQHNSGLRGIRAATIRLIRQALPTIDDQFRADPRASQLFMEILRQPCGVARELRRMNRYGVLSAYLPEFGRVVGRMQYDLFHVYTVDAHTLFVVRNLRRMTNERYYGELPFCHEVFRLIDRPEVLYVAGMMHDIAKGQGGDHSLIGEQIARSFAYTHGFTARDTELLCWLVKHHLVMSMTAQRKDIEDPDVVHEFATLVGDEDTLNHLYLLTVADIRATNPGLWNSWKDTLLRELYIATYRALRRGLEKPLEQAEKIRLTRADARGLLEVLGLDSNAVERVWLTFNDEYFLRSSVEEVAWHTIAIAATKPQDLPLVLLRPLSARGSAEVFIYTRDQDHLFSSSTAVLDQLGLTILNARIMTHVSGFAFISFQVLGQKNEAIREHFQQLNICTRLRQAVRNPSAVQVGARRRASAVNRHFAVRTTVTYSDEPQGRWTVMELLATDRPGLLSRVGQAFDTHGIRIWHAKVTTIGSRAEDLFYITGRDNRPLPQDGVRDELRATIVRLVGEL